MQRWFCRQRPLKTKTMENSGKNKSKKIAFTFTVGIHLLLFLFLLFTGFIIPKNENVAKAFSNGGLSMPGYKLIEVEAVMPSSSSSPSPKLLSDPNETDFRIEKTNSIVKSLNIDVSTDSEYETVLKKWSGHKKSIGQTQNLGGTDLGGIEKGNKEGKDNSVEIEDGTFLLANRSLLHKPEAILNSIDEGRVVVDIIVNESGKVISAIAGQRGSTTTSKVLFEKAVNAAFTARFNPSQEGIKEQRGTYTFVFTLE